MDVREKLVELIEKASYECDEVTRDLWDMREVVDGIADFLIANGVTVQEWISVKDRLPHKCDTVLACSMDLLTNKRDLYLARFDGKYWVASAGYLFGRVTHWRELPQPPKGE